jgi:transcriptional regulator GlxA family with amidase domain
MYDKRREALSRLSPVLTYIAENCTGKITVAQLAKLVNLSIFHFSRLFKDLTDRTVIAYVNNIRIHKAVELLTKTEISITDIALEAGFNDINYFSRLFKRHMKLSPQAFRRAAQGRDVS